MNVTRPLVTRKEHTFSVVVTNFVETIDMSVPGATRGYYIVASQFPDVVNFLTVFDQYRILECTVNMLPLMVTSFIAAAAAATLVPTSVYNHNVLSTCIDTDDGNAPANEAVVLNHESAILHGPFITKMARTWKPQVSKDVYQTGGFGGFSSDYSPWIDSASPNVQHYGFKAVMTRGSTAPTGTVTCAVYQSALIQFKKVF